MEFTTKSRYNCSMTLFIKRFHSIKYARIVVFTIPYSSVFWHVLCSPLSFPPKNSLFLELFCILKELQSEGKVFKFSLVQNVRRFFLVVTQFLFITSEKEFVFVLSRENKCTSFLVTFEQS